MAPTPLDPPPPTARARLEARPGARPAARPGARPAARPGARPAARPGARPRGLSRRQLLGAGALAGMGAAALSACSGPLAASVAGARNNPDGVTFWNLFTGGDGENMIAMEDAFRAANPDVPLEATTLAWGDPYYTKLALATVGGQAPDVAITHLTRMPLLADAGLLTDLGTVDLPASGITADKFTPAAWEKSQQDGRLYAVPIDTHPFVLFYNKDAARQVGLLGNDDVLVPLDGADTFLEAVTQMKQATGGWGGVVTIIADPATNWRWFTTLYLQAGGTILGDDGTTVEFDRDRAGDVLDFMASLTGAKGLFPPAVDPPGTTSLFGSGKAGFLLDGEWQVPTYEAAGTPFGVVPVPTIGGTQKASFADSHALVIPRSDKRSEQGTRHAVAFIRAMLDNSLTWAEGGHIPAWLPVQKSAEFAALTPQADYVQAAYDAAYDPKAWFTGSGSNFQTTLGSSVSSAQGGQMGVSAAVAQMASALEKFATTRPPVG